jgi:hypothetical protein
VSARLSPRIKNAFSRLNKTLFFSAVVLLAAVFLPLKTFAAAPDATTQNNYGSYLNLFDGPVNGKASGVSAGSGGALIKSATAATATISGLSINVDLGFISSVQDVLTKNWDRVKNDTATNNYATNDSFVVRVCDVADTSNCWINSIPYAGPLDQNVGLTNVLTRIIGGKEKQTTYIHDFSILSSGAQGKQWKFTRTSGRNEGTISDFVSLTLPKGSSVEVSAWYCAQNNGSENKAETAYDTSPQNDNMAKFGTLCGGGTYFRIGNPFTVAIPKDDTAVQAQVNTAQQATVGGTTSADNLPVCSFLPTGDGTINGCLARVAYGIYWLAAAIAGILGQLFDFFLGYSLDSKSYTYDFAVTGWKLVRDVANIFFIIVMVYTGFAAVFDTQKGGSSMRKIVPALIINAILINFSLFATRVVIDVSNITARMFYSQMIVCDQVNVTAGICDAAHAKRGTGGYWPLSEKIVSAFNPQDLFKAAVLQNTAVAGSNANSNALETDARTAGQTNPVSPTDQANYFMIVCLIAAIIMAFVGIMFFKVAFLFVGRVVGLYMAMIFSPFAFLSRDIPLFGKAKTLKWDSWVAELTSLAFMAPIFVFFLYIIFSFLSSDFVKQIGYSDTSGSLFAMVLAIGIPMAIIFFLLSAAQKAAEDMSGKIGQTIQSIGTQATGLATGAAIGVATGGVALAGSRLGSRAVKALGNSTGLSNWAASNADNSRIARWTNNSLSKAQTGSWDLRKANVAGVNVGGALKNNAVFSRLGIQKDVNRFSGVGEKYFEGGMKGQQERRQKELKDDIDNKINYAHLNDDQAKAVWKKHQERQVEKAGEKNWQNHVDGEATVKPTADALKTAKEAADKQQKEIERLEALIKNPATTAAAATQAQTDKATAESALANEKRAVATAETNYQSAKKATIQNLKNTGDYKKTAAYKKAQDEQTKKLEAYGDVKNGKDLTKVMKREYVEDRRNDSFWMKDGKQRKGLWTVGGAYGGSAAGIAGLGTGIIGAVGSIAAERIKFEQEALDSVTKAYIKDFDKTKGKQSKSAQLTKKLEDFDKTVEKALISRRLTTDQINSMDIEAKQKEFAEHVNDVQANYDTANAKFKKSEKEFTENKITEAEFKDASKQKKATEDELNKVKNLWANREKAQDDLAKEAEKDKPADKDKGDKK